MGAIEQFYQALRDDLVDSYDETDSRRKTESTIYRFMEKEEEEKAREKSRLKDFQKEKSLQLIIRIQRHLVQAGEIEVKEYLITVLELLMKHPKLGSECKLDFRLNKDAMDEQSNHQIYVSDRPEKYLRVLLEDLGVEGTEHINQQGRIRLLLTILQNENHEKHQLVMGRLKEPEYIKNTKSGLNLLVDAILNVAITLKIREFFAKTEFYSGKHKERESLSEKGRATDGKKDKMLQLLNQYCKEHGTSLFFAGNQKNGQGKSDEECMALLRTLNKSGNLEMVFPIQVDSETGCGIYILGREQLKKQGIFKKYQSFCTFAVSTYEPVKIEGGYRGAYQWYEEYTSTNMNEIRGFFEVAKEESMDSIQTVREGSEKLGDVLSLIEEKKDVWKKYEEQYKQGILKN